MASSSYLRWKRIPSENLSEWGETWRSGRSLRRRDDEIAPVECYWRSRELAVSESIALYVFKAHQHLLLIASLFATRRIVPHYYIKLYTCTHTTETPQSTTFYKKCIYDLLE